jgi:exodeoxyribonuclease VII large subunit
VLLLVRGGGSLEDLWAFNEEKVARAILTVRSPWSRHRPRNRRHHRRFRRRPARRHAHGGGGTGQPRPAWSGCVAPGPRLARLAARRTELEWRLRSILEHRLDQRRQALKGLARTLDTVSPLATLGRGYSITRRVRDGALLRAATEVAVGEEIETRLAEGGLISTVQRRVDQKPG